MQSVTLAPVATQHLMLCPVGLPVTGQAVQLPTAGGTGQVLHLVTGNQTGQSVQLTPTAMGTQTLQLVPTNAASTTLQLTTTAQAAIPQTTYYVVGGTASTTTLKLAPQTAAAQTLTLGRGDAANDAAYQVLTLGFGGSASKVQKFEKALKDKLSKLGGPGGPLSEQDLTSILMTTAKDLLRSNGFGIVFDDVLEPFLTQFVGKVIQDGKPDQPTQADQPNNTPTTPPANSSTPSAPAGSQTFNVTGRIILTPTSGAGHRSGEATERPGGADGSSDGKQHLGRREHRGAQHPVKCVGPFAFGAAVTRRQSVRVKGRGQRRPLSRMSRERRTRNGSPRGASPRSPGDAAGASLAERSIARREELASLFRDLQFDVIDHAFAQIFSLLIVPE